MRIAAFDTIEPAGPITALPVRLLQTSSRATIAFQAVIGAALIGAMAVPFVLLASISAEHPAARDIILARPGAGVQIALGLVLWTLLFALPFKGVLARLGSREVVIGPAEVRVTERSPFRVLSWSEPLSAYRGIAHHIRASVSGTRHELILVHRSRARSVMLAFADGIHQADIDRLARMLGVPEIHARELYRVPSRAAAEEPGLASMRAA